MKKVLGFLLVLAFALTTFACAEADGGFGGGYKNGFYGDVGASDTLIDSETDSEGSEMGEGESNDQEVVWLPAGMITAGAWNDNDNYQMWLSLFSQGNEEEEVENGKFYDYTVKNKLWGFNSLNRVKVTVTSDGAPVSGATVVAYSTDGNALLFSAVSDAQGNAYLFVTEDEGTVLVASGEGSATADFTLASRELSIELDFSTRDLHNSLRSEGNVMTEYEKNFSEQGKNINMLEFSKPVGFEIEIDDSLKADRKEYRKCR